MTSGGVTVSPGRRAWLRFRRNRIGYWSLVLFTLLVGPLGRLRECIEQVAKGDLGVTVTATGVREVNELATSMEHLVQHLRVTRGVQARPFGRSVGSRLG